MKLHITIECQVLWLADLWQFLGNRCITVRPMQRERCLVCPACQTETLVYCGQTVGWIKMQLGMEVGLGPGDIVLDGYPAKAVVPC